MSVFSFNKISLTLGLLLALTIGLFTSFINPIYALGFACFVPIVLFMILRPYTFVIWFLAYLPLEPMITSLFPAPLGDYVGMAPEALLLLGILAVVPKYNKKFSVTSIDILLMILIIWSVIVTALNDVSVFNSLNGFRVLFRYAAVYFIFKFSDVPIQETYNKLCQILVTLVLFEGVLGLFQVVGKKLGLVSYWVNFGGNQSMISSLFGVQGTLGRYDQYGMFLAVSGIILFGYILQQKRSPIVVLSLISGMLGIVLSTSRQSMVVFVIGVVLLFILAGKFTARKAKILFIAVYVSAIAGLVLYLFSQGLSANGRNPFELIASLFSSETYVVEKTTNFRLYFISTFGPWLMDNHFWGMGLGTFGAWFSLADYEWLYMSLGLNDNFINFIADVNWISILGQIGLIGVILFVLFQISIIRTSTKGIKSKGKEYRIILSTVIVISICFALSGFFGPNFEIKTNSIFFWVFAAFASKYKELKKSA